MSNSSDIRQILVTTKYRFIGDTILAVPALRAISQAWPNATVTLLSGARAQEVLLHCPYVHNSVEFDPYRKRDKGAWRYLRMVGELRARRFDLAVILNRSFHSALTASLSGARHRVGWSGFEGRDFLLTSSCPYRAAESEIDCYLDLVRSAGVSGPFDRNLQLWISDEDTTGLVPRKPAGPVLAIQPGASHQSKRWTPNGFAQVACRSMIDNDSLSVWILGGPDEAQAASDVVEAIDPRFRHRVLNLAGKLKLRETMFAISRASLFLGNDTAIRHVAIALDVPSIGLFGPTSAEKWGNAVPMKHLVLRSQSSDMADLPFQSVLEPVAHLLSKSYAHIV